MSETFQCPECGSRNVMASQLGNPMVCICGASGTPAYFTVAEVPEHRTEHVISRTFDVARDRPNGQHVASVNNAMMLLTQAAAEQDLELDWGTLRLLTSADGTIITFLAVIKGYEKAPLPEHDEGGVAISTPDGPKVIRKPHITVPVAGFVRDVMR